MTEVVKSPRRLSEYVRSLPTDVRTRYLAKTAALNFDPYCVLEVEFSSDATTWPPVEHVDVINYLIFTPSAYTRDQLKKYKSLDEYTSSSRMAGSGSYTRSLRICMCFLRRLVVLALLLLP